MNQNNNYVENIGKNVENLGKIIKNKSEPLVITGYDFFTNDYYFSCLHRSSLYSRKILAYNNEFDFIPYEEALNYFEDRINKAKRKISYFEILKNKSETLTENYQNELKGIHNKLVQVGNAIYMLKHWINSYEKSAISYVYDYEFYKKELKKYEKAFRRIKKRLYFYFDKNENIVEEISSAYLTDLNFNAYYDVFNGTYIILGNSLNYYENELNLFKENYKALCKKLNKKIE